MLGLAHVALPGDHRLVVGLAELHRRRDRKRAHEVLHVEPVFAPRPRALLLLQPDLFFGNVGQALERRHLAAVGVSKVVVSSIIVKGRSGASVTRFSLVINRIIT